MKYYFSVMILSVAMVSAAGAYWADAMLGCQCTMTLTGEEDGQVEVNLTASGNYTHGGTATLNIDKKNNGRCHDGAACEDDPIKCRLDYTIDVAVTGGTSSEPLPDHFKAGGTQQYPLTGTGVPPVNYPFTGNKPWDSFDLACTLEKNLHIRILDANNNELAKGSFHAHCVDCDHS